MANSLLCCGADSAKELLSSIRRSRAGSIPAPVLSQGQFRLAIVYSGSADLKVKLEQAEALAERSSESGSTVPNIYLERSNGEPSVAFLYPGQGSQAVGMLGGLRRSLPGFERQLERLDGIWRDLEGESLLARIYARDTGESEAFLRDTRQAQPALGLVSTALRLSLEALGVRARFHAGHSYGELPALCAAGCFDETALLRLSRERGRLLGEAGDTVPGAMVALSGERIVVEALCRNVDPELELVNLNSPRQLVAAGKVESVQQLEKAALAARISARRLNAACAFHSSLMAPVSQRWKGYLSAELQPLIGVGCAQSVFSNVSARRYESCAQVVELLGDQIVQPVRWSEVCQQMLADGVNLFIEMGPGRVLSDLVAKNLPWGEERLILPVDTYEEEDAEEQLVRLLARVFTRGGAVDWMQFARPQDWQMEVKTPLPVPAPGIAEERQATSLAPRAAEPFWGQHLLESSRELVERYFQQQSSLLQLALGPAHLQERASLVQSALSANQNIVAELLRTNEATLRSLLGQTANGSALAPPLARQAQSRPIPGPFVTPESKIPESPAEVMAALKAEIVATTGFPERAVSEDTPFYDLGLDSLTLAEIWGRLLDRVPALAQYVDQIFEIRCLQDVLRIYARKPAAPKPAAQQPPADVPSSQPAGPAAKPAGAETADELGPRSRTGRWTEVRAELVNALSLAARIDPEQMTPGADWERDLGLDVFTREACLQPLFKHERFGQAGRELLNARTLGELDRLMSRFALPAQPEADPPGSGPEAVERYILREEPIVSTPAVKGLGDSSLKMLAVIGRENSPLTQRLLALAAAAGVPARLATPDAQRWRFEGQAISFDDSAELRAMWARVFPQPHGVLFAVDGGGQDGLEHAALALFSLGQALWPGESTVSQAVSLRIVGADADGLAEATVRGLARSLARELPTLSIRSLWLRSSLVGVSDELLRSALFAAREENESIEEDGRLFRHVLEPCRHGLSERERGSAPDLTAASRILILGGGDGISAEIGAALAQAYGCEIVAVGRSAWPVGIPYPEIPAGPGAGAALKRRIFEELEQAGPVQGEALQRRWKLVSRQRALLANRARFEAAGGRFRYHQADVSDPESFRSALAVIREEGPLHGVIHGAGIVRDNLLARKTVEEFRSVLETKMTPALLIPELLASEPLRFVFYLSSMTAFTGTAGQTDYGAANELLNAAAHQWNLRAPYPVKALLWSVWSEAGLAGTSLKGHMERLGLGGIPTREGVKLLLHELMRPSKSEDWVLFAPASTLGYSLGRRSAAGSSEIALPVSGPAQAGDKPGSNSSSRLLSVTGRSAR